MFKGAYTNKRGETCYAGPRLYDTADEAAAYAAAYAAKRGGTNPRAMRMRALGPASGEWKNQ